VEIGDPAAESFGNRPNRVRRWRSWPGMRRVQAYEWVKTAAQLWPASSVLRSAHLFRLVKPTHPSTNQRACAPGKRLTHGLHRPLKLNESRKGTVAEIWSNAV